MHPINGINNPKRIFNDEVGQTAQKKYDPEFKMNMPMRHKFDSDNKIMQKKVPLCENIGIVEHFPIPSSFTAIMRNPFSLSNSITPNIAYQEPE